MKGRGEELQGFYDAGIEGFLKSQELQDLMSVAYLKGVRDGVLEAQAILHALEHVTDDGAHHIEEHDHVTCDEDHADGDIEILSEAVGDIPSPPASGDTSCPSGQEDLVYFENFGHLLF